MMPEARISAVESVEQTQPQIREYIIIPFTHIDYAWYANSEQVRHFSAVTWNKLLTELEEDPTRRFSAEASWTVDKYLQHTSLENRNRLISLTENGQVEVAPTYIIQEERIAGEEMRILNHLIGKRVLEENWGITPAPIGLANDAFGFDCQTPQERRQLGLDNFIYTQGDPEELKDVAVYRWIAPDGSWVYGIRQPRGYCSADQIGHNMRQAGPDIYLRPQLNPEAVRDEEAKKYIKMYDGDFGPVYARSELTTAALYHGSDLQRPDPQLPDIVEKLNKNLPGVQVRIGTHTEYLEKVRELPLGKMMTYGGELFSGRAGTLRGVDSTRIPQIKVNYDRMVWDTYVTLALTAFARKVMPRHRETLNDTLTRKLDLTSHDMLSGTVVDEVVREDMLPEFHKLHIADMWIQRQAMGYLAEGLELRYNEKALYPLVETKYSLSNLTQTDRSQLVFLPVHPSLGDAANLRAVIGGVAYPAQRLQEVKGQVAVVAQIPSYSSVEVEIQEAEASEIPSEKALSTVENEAMKITVTSQGIVLTDKTTGKDSLLSYRLNYDNGDSYRNHPLEDRPWMSGEDTSNQTSVRIVEDGPLFQEIEVTQVSIHSEGIIHTGSRTTLSETTFPLTIKTNIRLVKGIERADITVSVDNPGIKDYQLQAVLTTENPGKRVLTKENYRVTEKEAQEVATDSWFYPLATHHYTNNLISAGNISLMGKGLHAFNAEQEGEKTRLALTLLHGVEFLSQPDLYVGRPGYEHLVDSPAANDRHLPDAQCLGTNTLELAVAFGAKNKSVNQLAREANDFSIGAVIGPAGVDLSQTLKVDGGVVFGIKEAEDYDGLIYHIGNYGPTAEVVRFDRPVERSFLSEEKDSEYDEELQEMVLRPYEFCAICVR